MSAKAKYSALDIARALQASDPSMREPTDEQIAIIEAPLEPAVVIAGAGSGKTETMSARVLYLVANGLVRPDEILGLTFTRKAAGELGLRIRKRLRQLRQSGLVDKNTPIETAVMTYHSYAGRLLNEHAIRYGIDTNDEPLGDAAIWQMASELVTNWSDEAFTSESALNTVIDDVIGLTKLVLEHRTTSDEIRDESDKLIARLNEISSKPNEAMRKVVTVLNQRLSILPMVDQLIAQRRREGLLSFDDQMSLAADIANEFDDVIALERNRYRVVLLDEYQDTSQSQVRMLSALFGQGHPVMAVGDPYQAIYTWRGAASGTIGAFRHHFPKADGQTGPQQYSLSTTFRNDVLILNLANAITQQFRATGKVEVAPLVPRPGAGQGVLACGVFETIDAEANAIAEYFAKLWFDPQRIGEDESERSSFAVLVRKRSQIPDIELALRGAQIPVEVLGVGGLIHVAEVADVVSLLRVITNPDAGASLMRHLTGPRINLGAADIAALGRFSRERASANQSTSRGLIAKIVAGNPLREEADDQILGALIDALDEISHADRRAFTQEGFARLEQFAQDLRRLRSRAGGPLTDLIAEVENYLSLELEVMVRDGTENGRRHLDRFIDEAAKFARSGGTAHEFLAWLDVAESEEGGLKSGAPEVRRDVVQILTVHNAKGAEWDVVAVPGLAERSFPSSGMGDDNWLKSEQQIPFALRGDRDQLPVLNLSQCTSNAEVTKQFEEFADQCKAIGLSEEIRLGYVAFTRARTHLIATTSRWRSGKVAVAPSAIFETVAAIAAQYGGEILCESPAPDPAETNPSLENPISAMWPRDPLGARRAVFDAEVALVQGSDPHSLAEVANLEVQSWIRDSAAILNELNSAKSQPQVFLPPRLSVSTLVALKEDPRDLALSIRRPMPRAQDQYSRRGTIFHAWIESYFDQKTLFDDEDLEPVDPLEKDQTLDELKSKWLASAWAALQPYAVEVPFETVVSGVLLRGRMDAVYKIGERFEVVDWKTGSKKLGDSAAIQLAVYRLAWAKLNQIDISQVSASFHYVPTGVTDRRADLLDESGLIDLIAAY